MQRVAICLTFLIFINGVIFTQSPDADEVLRTIDSFYSYLDNDFSAEYSIVSDSPDEERSIFKIRVFRRDSEDKFLLLILDPLLNRGEGYLQVDDTGWSYDPESREFSIFNLSESFQDSESRNSDFADRNLVEDYKVVELEEGTLGKYSVYVMDLEATTDTVAFPRVRFWVRDDNYLVLKSEDYSLSGRLVRTSYFPSYGRSSGNYVPTKMLFVDNLNPGEQTEITVRDISFKDLPDIIFTRSYLEQVNR